MCKIPVSEGKRFSFYNGFSAVQAFHKRVRHTSRLRRGMFSLTVDLMLAEYNHFSPCVKRNIVFLKKIHVDRIVDTESPNLRSFRERLIMDCIKKRDLISPLPIRPRQNRSRKTLVSISLFSFPAIGSPFMCTKKSPVVEAGKCF